MRSFAALRMTMYERFPVESRVAKRAKRVQTMQHVLAAFILGYAGYQHLQRAHHDLILPLLEIAAAAILIGAALRERFRQKHDPVGWVEIAGGVMSIVEGVVRAHERHRYSLINPFYLQALALFAVGILDVHLARLRYLEANDTHFVVRLRAIIRRSVRWSEARSFRFRDRALDVESEWGTRTFSLRNVINFDDAKAWTIEQFRRRGILAAEELPRREK